MTESQPQPAPEAVPDPLADLQPGGLLLKAAGQPKPGWKTTEFWAMLLVVGLSNVLAFGLVSAGSPVANAIGAAIATITNLASFLGYNWARTRLKTQAAQQTASALEAEAGGQAMEMLTKVLNDDIATPSA